MLSYLKRLFIRNAASADAHCGVLLLGIRLCVGISA